MRYLERPEAMWGGCCPSDEELDILLGDNAREAYRALSYLCNMAGSITIVPRDLAGELNLDKTPFWTCYGKRIPWTEREAWRALVRLDTVKLIHTRRRSRREIFGMILRPEVAREDWRVPAYSQRYAQRVLESNRGLDMSDLTYH